MDLESKRTRSARLRQRTGRSNAYESRTPGYNEQEEAPKGSLRLVVSSLYHHRTDKVLTKYARLGLDGSLSLQYCEYVCHECVIINRSVVWRNKELVGHPRATFVRLAILAPRHWRVTPWHAGARIRNGGVKWKKLREVPRIGLIFFGSK